MSLETELKQVRRLTGGRVHLGVEAEGDRQALCGAALEAGTYELTDRPADCRSCLRRKDDPTRLSSAFFASDQGSRLLELSLEQARRRPRRQPAPGKPAVPPPSRRAPKPEPEPEPEVLGELYTAGFRRFAENTFTSPAGVIVHMSGERVADVTFEGRIQVRRSGAATVTLRAGDVDLTYSAKGGKLLGVCRKS